MRGSDSSLALQAAFKLLQAAMKIGKPFFTAHGAEFGPGTNAKTPGHFQGIDGGLLGFSGLQ
jgi:hypothetical protein